MRALFFREVRRLAPVAGAVLLGIFLVLALAHLNRHEGRIPPESIVMFGSVLGALLLGVATIAPDTDSGAIAFLARLPIPPARALAAKLAAALLWVAAIVLIASVSRTGVPAALWHERLDLGGALAVALGSGVLASVMSRRTLAAAVLAPIAAAAAFLLFVAPVTLGLGMRSLSLEGPIAFGFSAAFVAIAFLAFMRGDRHRASWRPAVLGLGGLVLLDVLSVSSAALAHGWSIHDSPRWMTVRGWTVASADGRRVALELGGTHWEGYEERIAVVDRAEKTARLLPVRYAEAVGFSPDGRRLLAASLIQPGGWLVDIETGSVENVASTQEGVTNGFATRWVLWRDARPILVHQELGRIELREPGDAVAARQASRGRIVGTVEGRIAVLDQGHLSLLDPWTGRSEEVLVAKVDGEYDNVEAAFSPRGERAVILVNHGADATKTNVYVLDRASGAKRDFVCEMTIDRSLGHDAFSPDLRKIALSRSSECCVLDLETGSVQRFEDPEERDSELSFPAWSPDGARLVLPWGEIRDLASGKAWRATRAIVMFVTPGVGVPVEEPLAFVDVETGAATARPLEGR